MKKDVSRKIIAIIPARGNSKGISRKNVRRLAGKPLVSHTIEMALRCSLLDEVILSTEDRVIMELGRKFPGLKVVKRPKKLSRDEVSAEEVAFYHCEKYGWDEISYVFLLQPTSPLRDPEDLLNAWAKMISTNADSCFSACYNKKLIWKHDGGTCTPINHDPANRLDRRETMAKQVAENGSIYITTSKAFKESGKMLSGRACCYLMPEFQSIDIDGELDFFLTEAIINGFK